MQSAAFKIGKGKWVFFLLSSFFFLVMMGCGGQKGVPNLVRDKEPGFTGVARCAACHTDGYAEWKKSLHSLAMTVPTDSTVVGDFDHASHTYSGVTSQMYKRDGNFYMKTEDAQGQMREFRVDYTIGVRQHQAYITQFDDGRYQVLPLYHDGATNAWVDAQEGGVVEQHQALMKGDYYFWTNAGRTWNFHCFDCHASRVEKNYDVSKDAYRTTVGNLAIDCEACHGPSAKHDETRGQPGAPLYQLALRLLDKEQAIEVCTQCHAAKEILAEGYLPGKNYYDYYTLVLPDDNRFFYPDGQPRVYIYPGVLHLMSPCYVYDDLRCTTCHDAHGSGRNVDLVADREGVGLCEKCHEEIAHNPVAHGHHKPGSVGNQCVQCHMPYHHVTGEHLTDHRIVSPVPQNTIENGVPNACNQSGCHADQSAQWASRWAVQWYGDYQDREVARATAVDLAQKGDQAAVSGLLDLAKDGSPVWRATAAGLLGRLGDVRALSGLLALMDDGHPMVRLKATVALGRLGDVRALPRLIRALSDSARAVRVSAPFALWDVGFFPDEVTHQAFEDALVEHQAVVASVQSDDPGYHEGLGQVYERQGKFDAAEKEYAVVAKLDPAHPETAADMARLLAKRDLYSRLQKRFEDAKMPLLRGAAMVQFGRFDEAVKVLSDVNGQSAMFFVVRGDALWGGGQRADARAAYLKALEMTPLFKPALRRLAQMAFSFSDVGVTESFDELPPFTWAEHAVAAIRQGDFDRARTCFAMVMAAEDRGDASVGLGEAAKAVLALRADSVFVQASKAYEGGDFETALRGYDRVIQLNPERADVHALMGLMRADDGALTQAEVHLYDALLVQVTHVSALTLLGTVFQDRGQLDEALKLYQVAWFQEPTAAGLEFLLGQAYLMTGNQDSARAVLSRVVKREPNNVQARALLNQAGGRAL